MPEVRPEVAVDSLLLCSGCDELFDLDGRRPKLCPCGHTLCRACILDSWRDGSFSCPTDSQVIETEPDLLRDDLQVVCWLDAATEGMLECVCCKARFDWLWRRPVALDCGHTVCRVCLQDSQQSSPRSSPRSSKQDSLDEFWDYSQEDDGQFSTTSPATSETSSQPSGETVDCPVEGCGMGIQARENLRILNCLDRSPSRTKVNRKRKQSEDSKIQLRLLDKLSKLEDQLSTRTTLVCQMDSTNRLLQGHNVSAIVGRIDEESRFTSFDSYVAKKIRTEGDFQEQSYARQFDESDLNSLLKLLRQVVEHKDSPRCEHPVVLNQAHSLLPDLISQKNETPQIANHRRQSKSREDLSGINSLVECMVVLNVSDLSRHGPGDMRVKKEALLHSDQKVYEVTGLDCWFDPDWTLRLLQRVAPHLEQLQVRYPGREHLRVIRDAMPHLRRLEVRGWKGAELLDDPVIFDEEHPKDTLEWLEVLLPRKTAVSLIRAHRHSLRKLRVLVHDDWVPAVGDEGPDGGGGDPEEADDDLEDEDGFQVVPFGVDTLRSCCWEDLGRAFLADEGDFGILASVALLWLGSRQHDSWQCKRFARDLGATKPLVTVHCELCR